MNHELGSHIRNLGIDVFGVAKMARLTGMPIGIPVDTAGFLAQYPFAVVLGAQLGKVGKNASGGEVSLFLEEAALEVLTFLEERGCRGLIIHTVDEFDPIQRLGFMSLKVLAKAAGLGWQGRSLMIVSPDFGPLHRLIAVLTNMELEPNEPMSNRCEDCSVCVDKCPEGCLTLVWFEDHPARREDVLDMAACRGDFGCKVCLAVCPWTEMAQG